MTDPHVAMSSQQSLIMQTDHHIDRRRAHYSRSYQRVRQTSVLPYAVPKASLSNTRMGRLDTDLHHSHVHEGLNMSIPPTHSGLEESKDCHV